MSTAGVTVSTVSTAGVTVSTQVLLYPQQVLLCPQQVLLCPQQLLCAQQVLLCPQQVLLCPQQVLLCPQQVSTVYTAGVAMSAHVVYCTTKYTVHIKIQRRSFTILVISGQADTCGGSQLYSALLEAVNNESFNLIDVCLLLFCTIATVIQLHHGGDVMYEMRRTPKLKGPLTSHTI